jgi:prepilin-type N-terminal cleavage/methylation domain-containing protein
MIYSRTERGFSLIEILITLVIMAVIAGFSVEGISSYFQQREQRVFMQQLYHDLKWTRVEAIVLGVPVAIQAKDVDWCGGWIIFKNSEKTGFTAESQLLKTREGIKNCKIVFSSSLKFSYFQFFPEGSSNYQAGHFYFYNQSNLTMKIIINQIGRVSWVS